MHIDLNTITSILGFLLTIVSGIAVMFSKMNTTNKYITAVITAVFAATKVIDRIAYDSTGAYNKAREDIAILILSKLIKNFDDTAARTDIEGVLAEIHTHVQNYNALPIITSVALKGKVFTLKPNTLAPAKIGNKESQVYTPIQTSSVPTSEVMRNEASHTNIPHGDSV